MPLKNFLKNNFVLTAIWFIAAMVLGFVPATVQAATSTVTVTAGDGGTVSPNYNGKQLILGQTYKLQAKPKSGFVFTGWTGSQVSGAAKITFVMDLNLDFTATFADVKAPTLTLKTPVNKSTFVGNLVTVTGTTKDNSTIAQVLYQLNGTGWVAASTGNGWSNWWVDLALDLGTNTFQAYAVDTTGNISKTNQLTLYYRVVPDSINGQTMVVSNGGNASFTVGFTNSTFSQSAADTNFVDGVGSFTFARTSLTTARLVLNYTAPSNATNADATANLQFTSSNSGWFTNGDGSQSTFILSVVTNVAPITLSGASFNLVSTNADMQRSLTFIAEPTIVGSAASVVNPLVLPVSSPYAGNIGDRVSVLFIRFNHSGVVSNNFVGTLIAATGSNVSTNTVTVLFDSSSFVSQGLTPTTGGLLHVLTFYYTNFVSGSAVSDGQGTYTYATYSPVGALLNLAQTNESSAYVLTFDDTGNSGTYYQQISPVGGGSSSDAGVFGFIAPPQIISNPQSVSITNGANAAFTVTASGSTPLTYQWQTNNVELTDGGNISGSSTATLNLTAITSNNIAGYFVIVANAFGSVTSSVANLNIIAPPQIVTPPQSQTVTNGATAIFTVSASGSTPLAYRWQRNSINLSDFGNVTGSATPTLSLTSVTTNDISNFRVIINNAYGSVTSSIVNLDVTP